MQITFRLLLVVWLPIFATVLAFGLLLVLGLGNRRLAYHYAQTQGVSLGVSPHKHGMSLYRFEVGNLSYRGEGSQGHGYIPAGEPISVYYVAANPQISCLDDPLDHWHTNLLNVFVAATMVATGVLGLILLAQRTSTT